jgi:hypothetical protein
MILRYYVENQRIILISQYRLISASSLLNGVKFHNSCEYWVKHGTWNADNATYGGEKEFLTARTDFFGSEAAVLRGFKPNIHIIH